MGKESFSVLEELTVSHNKNHLEMNNGLTAPVVIPSPQHFFNPTNFNDPRGPIPEPPRDPLYPWGGFIIVWSVAVGVCFLIYKIGSLLFTLIF